MSNSITRTYSFSNGGVADGGQVDSEIQNIVNTINNADAGTTAWTVCNATTLKYASQDIAQILKYRRPNLVYSSATVVNIETGLSGTSAQLSALFPDYNYRTDSTTARIQCNLAQVAALTGSVQSGLRTGTVANNTWYAIYLVKSQANSSDIVAVADTVIPTQANFSSLNTNFGASSWLYNGMIVVGFGWGGTMDGNIAKFVQTGNKTVFGGFTANNAGGSNATTCSWKLASATGAATCTWSYAAGTGAAQVPAHITSGSIIVTTLSGTGIGFIIQDSGGNYTFTQTSKAGGATNTNVTRISDVSLLGGFKTSNTAAENETQDIGLVAYYDGVLGIGSPQL